LINNIQNFFGTPDTEAGFKGWSGQRRSKILRIIESNGPSLRLGRVRRVVSGPSNGGYWKQGGRQGGPKTFGARSCVAATSAPLGAKNIVRAKRVPPKVERINKKEWPTKGFLRSKNPQKFFCLPMISPSKTHRIYLLFTFLNCFLSYIWLKFS
jgi:hypothetical protein